MGLGQDKTAYALYSPSQKNATLNGMPVWAQSSVFVLLCAKSVLSYCHVFVMKRGAILDSHSLCKATPHMKHRLMQCEKSQILIPLVSSDRRSVNNKQFTNTEKMCMKK